MGEENCYIIQRKEMVENLSVYNELRVRQQLCDAVIRVNGVEFMVHKVILCSCSLYFRALFTQWSTPDCHIFDIPNVTPELIHVFIKFAYTGSVTVSPDNVKELFIAADCFSVTGILKACSEFLERTLAAENCIGIWLFTDMYYYPELREKAFLFILNHFEEVVATSEDFLFLSAQELVKIIQSDQLIVKQEESVYKAILQWIAFANDERREYIPLLLSNVRLVFMNQESIISITESEIVQSSPECQVLLLECLDPFFINMANTSNNPVVYKSVTRLRAPTAILLGIGGWASGHPTNIIEAYDARVDRWAIVDCTEQTPRAYHGTVFLNGSVYFIGGFDGVVQFSSVHRFDLITHTWHEVSPMHVRRCFVSVTILDGYIYAMGGYNGHKRLETAERYDPTTNQWSLIAPMHEKRSDASATAFHGRAYICGGFNGSDCLSTAECYNPTTNRWTMITPMSIRRSGIGAIAYANKIFAVGGYNGIRRLHTAEAYDPLTNTWCSVSSMLVPRSNFGISVIDDRLFVAGGYNGFSTTSEVEFYDVETGIWSKARDMEVSRSALSSCVVYGLSNMTDFAIPFNSHQ